MNDEGWGSREERRRSRVRSSEGIVAVLSWRFGEFNWACTKVDSVMSFGSRTRAERSVLVRRGI